MELVKAVGHSQGGGGLLGFAQGMLSAATGGAKFTKEDVKHVYFVRVVVPVRVVHRVLTCNIGKLASGLLPGKDDVVIPSSIYAR